MPLQHQVGDELQREATEILRLRKALMSISDVCHYGPGELRHLVSEAREIALAALSIREKV